MSLLKVYVNRIKKFYVFFVFILVPLVVFQGCSYLWPSHIIVKKYPKELHNSEADINNISDSKGAGELAVDKLILNLETDWYTVGPDDVLGIKVWEHGDLSIEAKVMEDGTIDYPFFKKINVGGKTVTEISEMLISMLGEGYVYNPQVFVSVKEYKSKKVYVVGEAEKNGTYYLKKPTTLFEFITQMGGMKKTAGNRLLVKRLEKNSDGERMVEIEIPVVDGEVKKNILLMEDDVIDIPEAKFFIAGEISKPGYYTIQEEYNIYQAIVVAGDFTKAANETKVKLSRDNGKTVLVINVEKIKKGLERGISAKSAKFREQLEELKIHDGDMIIVPKSIFYSE